jgi:hypothetical protein
MRVEQMERDNAVVDFASRLLAALVRTDNIAVLRQVLPEALPWSTFLPAKDLDTLLAELVATVRGAVALDNLTRSPFSSPSGDTAPRSTPILICMPPSPVSPEGDLGPAPMPEATE